MRSARLYITILAITLFPLISGAQSHLSKGVSVKATQKTVEEVLDIIGRQGKFYFSYNSKVVPADSLVDIDAWNKTVVQALDALFKPGRFEYKETQNHVIIQSPSAGQYWYVSGYVIDGLTGERVRDVSVFDAGQLVASLTNDQGYFKLKLRDKMPSTTINVSKSLYNDTLINIKPGVDQEVKVTLNPRSISMDTVVISSKESFVEGTWLGKVFLSSKLRMQSLNIGKFFVDMPVQGSIIPGLSSQGRMSAQVVNRFSFNMLGGYTAGVDGMEMAGVFNINKKSVRYLQVAGVFNVTGGNAAGVQASGVYNQVMDSVAGLQVAGLANVVKGKVAGVQGAGIYNLSIGRVTGGQLSGVVNTTINRLDGLQAAGVINSAIKNVAGAQAAGVINLAIKDVKGVQAAGVVNACAGSMRGLQVSGVVNYATRLRGAQIGLVNIADSSSGVGIGLFSFVLKGYHKMSVSANEAFTYNVALKTGTHWLYNIYSAGASLQQGGNAYILGTGYGSELPISKRFSINPELTGHAIYLGNWSEVNSMVRLQLNLNVHLGKYVSLFAGPSFSGYWDNKQPKVEGYKTEILPSGYKRTAYGSNLSSWVGWNAGVTIF
ncbi:MAG TPA: hypothetical protein VIN07_03765 [Flavipsychrobacter sp.]